MRRRSGFAAFRALLIFIWEVTDNHCPQKYGTIYIATDERLFDVLSLLIVCRGSAGRGVGSLYALLGGKLHPVRDTMWGHAMHSGTPYFSGKKSRSKKSVHSFLALLDYVMHPY